MSTAATTVPAGDAMDSLAHLPPQLVDKGNKFPVHAKVAKNFFDPKLKAERPFAGKIVEYDVKAKLYKVMYEDGDSEEYNEEEMEALVVKTEDGKIERLKPSWTPKFGTYDSDVDSDYETGGKRRKKKKSATPEDAPPSSGGGGAEVDAASKKTPKKKTPSKKKTKTEGSSNVKSSAETPALKKLKALSKGNKKPAMDSGDTTDATDPMGSATSSPASTTKTPSAKTLSSAKAPSSKLKTPSSAKTPSSKPKTPSSAKTPSSKLKTPSSAKTSSSKKSATPRSASKSKSVKPTLTVLIHEAIAALKDRTGSSTVAISKYLLAKHEHLEKMNPKRFKNSMSMALKTAVKQERFIKIKASYKINAAWVKKEKAALRKKESEKKAKDKKRKAEVEKALKAAKKRVDTEKKEKDAAKKKAKDAEKKAKEAEKKEKEEKKKREAEAKKAKKAAELAEKKRKEAELKKKKAEEERKRKELAAKLRKRKFPMDDLALIAEDKSLGVKPPEDVKERPSLPCVMLAAIPFDERKEDINASIRPYMMSASSLSRAGSCSGSRGLMADLLQVYHFFRGDVGYSRIKEDVTPDFALKHLICAVQEIICGNAKKARVVPPLISHLFVTALRILTDGELKQQDESDGEDSDSDSDEESESKPKQQLSPQEQKLRADLSQLNSILKGPMAPISWAEICYCYMDTMHRYYTSSASTDSNIVPGCPVDDDFFGFEASPEESSTTSESDEDGVQDGDGMPLPRGYSGYLGKPRGALARACGRLRRSDPWMLSAEELVALLRALTDDILANDLELAENLSERVGELQDLLREKRLADQEFYKVRRAFQGPRKPGRSKKDSGTDEPIKKDSNETQAETENADSGAKSKKEKKEDAEEKEPAFKPTATEKEFHAAEKAQQKARENYEKGLKKLISRTEPVGYDRFGYPCYHFQHDPESLYVEVIKPTPASFVPETLHDTTQGTSRSWQIIDTKSKYDEFTSSLDLRGVREGELWDTISGGNSYMRRFLHDDQKRINAIMARERQMKELERRLENAKSAAEAEEGGRRSGRLASLAHNTVADLEEEIKVLAATEVTDAKVEPVDYEEITGLEALSEFEKEQNEDEDEVPEYGTCSDLWYVGNEEENGAVGVIVDAMLELEEQCEELAPWQRKDISRASWQNNLRDIVRVWTEGDFPRFGPPPPDEDESQTPIKEVGNKKQKKSKNSTPGAIIPDKKARGPKKSKNKSTTPVKPTQNTAELVEALKTPLTDLEDRVYTLTGLKVAAEAADEAGFDASDDDSEDEDEQMENYRKRAQQAWKKEVDRLNRTATTRSGMIKSIIISAMTIARQAHLSDVLAELRAALLLHRPTAAHPAKKEALEVLKKHGGYDKEEDDGDDFDLNAENPETAKTNNSEEAESMLSTGVHAFNGFLGGGDNADRVDWADAVKTCSTLSKLAALTQAFIKTATQKLDEIETKRETLLESITALEGTKKKNIKTNEVWADFQVSSRFCMAKVAGYPWWPARICNPRDKSIASSLKSLDRVLVAFVGEENMHILKESEIRPYTGEKSDEQQDLSRYKLCDEQTKKAYELCIEMTRRICRKRGIINTPRKRKHSSFQDEKKTEDT